MTQNYTPKKGDRVRVVIEGEVTAVLSTYLVLNKGAEQSILDHADMVSVEKIEPPVVQFKPGDRLRRLDGWGYEVTLGTDGYLQHHLTGRSTFYPYGDEPNEAKFNSARYEKVEL